MGEQRCDGLWFEGGGGVGGTAPTYPKHKNTYMFVGRLVGRSECHIFLIGGRKFHFQAPIGSNAHSNCLETDQQIKTQLERKKYSEGKWLPLKMIDIMHCLLHTKNSKMA